MHELVKDARRLIITVSGHGDQIPNLNGAEKDGYDEGRKLTSLFNFLESPHHPTVIFPVDINYTGPGDFDNYIMDDVRISLFDLRE